MSKNININYEIFNITKIKYIRGDVKMEKKETTKKRSSKFKPHFNIKLRSHFKLKLSTQIISIILLASVIASAIGALGIVQLQKVDSSVDFLYENSVLGLMALSDVKYMLQDINQLILMSLLSEDSDQQKALEGLININNKKLMQRFEDYKKLAFDDIQKINIVPISKRLEDYKEYADKILAQNKTGEKNKDHLNELTQKKIAVLNNFITLEKHQQELSQELYNESKYIYATSRSLLITILAVGAILIMCLGGLVYRSVAKRLKSIVTAANKLEQGDLQVAIACEENKTEIGQVLTAFGNAILNLRQLIGQINENTEGVAHASNELKKAAEETGAGSEQVARVIEELAKTTQEQTKKSAYVTEAVEHMLDAVNSIMESYKKAQENTENANKLAENGYVYIEQAVDQMKIIEEVSADTGGQIAELGELSIKISAIVDIIRDIAQQTDLLALNAAIEAARAGEHGLGFAVVADEVKKLAEQAEGSAKQIANIIVSIQKGVDSTINIMNKGSKEVDKGLKVIETSGSSFMQIRTAVNNSKIAMEDVGEATERINEISRQVKENIETIIDAYEGTTSRIQEVSATVEEQSAAMEEVIASTSDLSNIAEKSETATQRFNL